MDKIAALVPKPKVADEIRESVVELLRVSLAEAEQGEIDVVTIIMGYSSGEWIHRCSSTQKLSEAIGHLEIAKQDWINLYFRERDD